MVKFEGIEEVMEQKPPKSEVIEPTPEYGAESDERAESIRREFIAYVEKLLERQENFVGKGSIAEVHELDANSRICVKIINDSRGYGTIDHVASERPYYNSPKLEAEFMADLQSIRGEVGVPKPYYYIERNVIDPSGESAAVSALAMEHLDAVSIDDVLMGREPLPAAYDPDTFWDKIERFLERMHDKGIFHRDIKAGNLMIGRQDAKPYVIDFGMSAYSSAYDAYTEPGVRGNVHTRRFTEDFGGMRKTRKDLSKWLLTKKK